MSDQHIQLTDDLRHYMLSVSLREHPILQKVREFTQNLLDKPFMLLPEQGQFLAWLIKSLQVKRALEIGTYTGYSSMAIALALPAQGCLISCDNDDKLIQSAKHFWQQAGVADKIDFCLGPALTTLQNLLLKSQAEQFDFIFIDADKINYLAYYELSLQLVRAGGVIVFDNTLWYGNVIDEGDQRPSTLAIRQLNQLLYADQRIDLSLLPLGDGMSLVRKK